MAKIAINLGTGDVKKQDDVVIGIDLGTTNSLVAYADDTGQPHILHRNDSSRLLPSVIYFDESNHPHVGESALSKMSSAPERTIFSVKRLMGKSWKDVETYADFFAYDIIEKDVDELLRVRIGDKFYTPIELSAMILRKLKQIAEEELGQNISKAVITVPAYFNDSQRQATKDAGKLAGLDVLRIINEPTAASLAFGLGDDQLEKIIAVYDLGGGTFDISILRMSNGVFEVLATHGDTFLGGDDFDKRIMEEWADSLKKQKIAYSTPSLRILAEEAKKELSKNKQIEKRFNGAPLSIDLDRFTEITADLVKRTLDSCAHALNDAQLDKSDIDEIILVGGSTRMPAIRLALAAYFEKSLNTNVHPDLAIALGAAVQADILAGKRKDMLLLDVTPLSLGIETVGGLMDVILPRNSKIPAAVGRNYTTSVDGQKNLKVAIYQGERDLVSDNRKLGEFILRNIPPMAAGLPKIEIKFIIDADGILQVVATELRSGMKQEIQVKPSYGISEEEMAQMLLESISNAESDIRIRALIEARTEAKTIVQSADRFLKQNESWLTEEQSDRIESLKDELERRLLGNDKDEILSQIEALNEYTSPLAHEALDRNIANKLSGKSIE